MSAPHFRFQNLEVWLRAAAVSSPLFAMADRLDHQKRYRFSEQLRGAALSITNNIAEGSGSVSKAEFAQFLNISRRSVFEVASMLLLFSREHYFDPTATDQLLPELHDQSRMLLAFRRNLLRDAPAAQQGAEMRR